MSGTSAATGLALVLALVVGVSSGCTAEPATPSLGSLSGFSPGGKFPFLPDDELERDLDRIAGTGAGWVRIDFAWTSVESERGMYDWSNLDRVTSAARAAGVSVLALVAYSPKWARPGCDSDKCPPDSVEDFATFVTAAARRYGPDLVQAWELWNEPNIEAFWKPRPDAERYAALLRSGAAALRAERRQARILSAGLSPAATDGVNIAPVDFLASLYRSGAMEDIDIVAIHPYSGASLPLEQGTEAHNTFLQLQDVYEVMVAHGDGGKSIWGTEFGVATGSDGRAVSEDQQAAIIAQGFERLRDRTWPWLRALFVYSLRDEREDPADWQANFGLLRHDGQPKPAFDEFRRAMGRRLPPQGSTSLDINVAVVRPQPPVVAISRRRASARSKSS